MTSPSPSPSSLSSLLPDLLELSVHLSDGVRQAGSTLSGSLRITVPNAISMQRLQQQQTRRQQGGKNTSNHTQAATASSQPSTATSLSINTAELESLLSPADSSSPTAAVTASLQPLAKSFPFEIKMQMVGKCIVDTNKVAMVERSSLHPNRSQPAPSNQFKTWCTKIITLDCTDPATAFPRNYEFRVALPDSLTPSFRGVALTQLYFVHIMVLTKLNKRLLEWKLPFRVRVGGRTVMETPNGLVSELQHCLIENTPGVTQALIAGSIPSMINPSLQLLAPTPSSSAGLGMSTSPAIGSSLTAPTNSLASSSNLLAVPSSTLVDSSKVSDPSAAASHSRSHSRRNSGSSPGHQIESHASTPLTFNISKTVMSASQVDESAHVVKLTLDQSYLRPGDTVRGHLDFSQAQIRCYRVVISLEQIEKISDDFSLTPVPFTSRKSFWTFHSYTVNTLSTHFTFCLPLDGVANFVTERVDVSWNLVFKFITDVDVVARSSWSFLPAPSTTKAEALIWNLPLSVMPHDDVDAVKQKILKTMLFSSQPIA